MRFLRASAPKAPAHVAALLVTLVTLSCTAAETAATGAVEDAAELGAARQALADGNLDAARLAFTELVAKEPQSVAAHLGLAAVAERKGDLLQALHHARQALTAAPGSSVAALGLARYLARVGRLEQALEVLEIARSSSRNDPEVYLVAAYALRELGHTGEAVAQLEAAMALSGAPPQVFEELSRLLLASGRVTDAVASARAGLEAHPDRSELEVALGLALAADSATRELAAEPLTRALERDIANRGLVELTLGELLLESGDLDGAVARLHSAAEELPGSAQARYRLAAALGEAGDTTGAARELETFRRLSAEKDAAERRDKELGIRLNEAQALLAQNQLATALAKLKELLDEDPRSPRALALSAKALFSVGRIEEAWTAIDLARRLAPGSVENHFLAGMFAMQRGQSEDAVAALSNALALDPSLAEAHALLASLAADQDRPEEAAAHFDRALALGAESPALRLRYAETLRRLGRERESQEQMAAYRRLGGG